MADFTIRTYGDPVLRTPGEPVREFGPALRSLGDAMLAAMRKAKGIGLAAPQVGLSLQLPLRDRVSVARPRQRALGRYVFEPDVRIRGWRSLRVQRGQYGESREGEKGSVGHVGTVCGTAALPTRVFTSAVRSRPAGVQ